MDLIGFPFPSILLKLPLYVLRFRADQETIETERRRRRGGAGEGSRLKKDIFVATAMERSLKRTSLRGQIKSKFSLTDPRTVDGRQ